MPSFTSDDREQVEKEPIPFYGYCCLTDLVEDENTTLHSVSKKFKVEYRIDNSSEYLEE